MGYTMMRAGSSWGLKAVALGLALSAMMFVGCNEGAKFDPDLLFSLEDYADDTDYANVYLDMINQSYESLESSKPHLAGNESGIPFVEVVPDGWNPVAESEVLSSLPGFADPSWFFSYQGSAYEVIRFDAGVPDTNPFHPARVDYGRIKYQTDPLGGQHVNGAVTSLWYTDDYQNQSSAEGGASFNSVEVLFFTQGSAIDQNFPAGMVNGWTAELTNVSALPHNPSAAFTITGQTLITRVDTQDMVFQDIEATAVIRSNGRGEGTISVEGIERCRFVFESRDTRFHGYVTVLSSNFEDRLTF